VNHPPRPAPVPSAVRLGTRRSPMARAQADRAVRLLRQAHPGLAVEVVARSAPGDRHSGPLGLIGGKRSWVGQLDAALAAGEVDVTVSCAKDLPSDHDRAPGTEVGAVLPREEVRDVLLWPAGAAAVTLETLAPGALVGTGAPRRIAQLAAARDDVTPVPIRGNLGTRLRRHLDEPGEGQRLDGLVVARAGLVRTGMLHRPHHVLPTERMAPATGAGIIVVEHRAGDGAMAALLAPLNHAGTYAAFAAERAVLTRLRGDCATACSVHAAFAPGGAGDQLTVSGRVFAPGGGAAVARDVTGPGDRPEVLGRRLADMLLTAGAATLLPGGARGGSDGAEDGTDESGEP
jgi:hydroxymethylbilane synthase